MSKIEFMKIGSEIMKFCERLTYNGLNLVSNESIRQIESFLQSSSLSESYRLATSLRYLHVELKRYITQSPAFNKNRYAFFLNNCWLLGRAFSSVENIEMSKKAHIYEKLLGKSSHLKENLKEINLRVCGIEKVYLEGVIMGLILHLQRLDGEAEILRWNLLQSPKGITSPEIILNFEIPNSRVRYVDLLFQDFTVKNLKYAGKENIISLSQEPPSNFICQDEKTKFPIQALDKYIAEKEAILKKLQNISITPFDVPNVILGYITLKKVKISEIVTGNSESENEHPFFLFKLSHDLKYPIGIRLKDKLVNQGLIVHLKEFKKKETQLDIVFGKLSIDQGRLNLTPLSVFIDGKEDFICISNDKLDLRQIVKNLYEKTNN